MIFAGETLQTLRQAQGKMLHNFAKRYEIWIKRYTNRVKMYAKCMQMLHNFARHKEAQKAQKFLPRKARRTRDLGCYFVGIFMGGGC